MGCFDVSCGISSVTIKHGEDALILLIMPYTDYPDSDRITGTVEIQRGMQQVFNEGPLGMYMPFCLPIRGKYNDYGSLEDIVEDETVKKLEEFFEAKLEQIFEVIYRGKYGKLHDGEILTLYGNGLKIDSHHSQGSNVTKEWLIEAGFVEKDGKFYHPDVTNILKWNSGHDKIEKTNEQKCYVEFKVPFKGSNEKSIMPHIVYWENDKWNEIWQRDQRDFCGTFMEKSRPMGWFADDYGVVLGIKKEKLSKALLLRKLSGMFIDGKVYDMLTDEVKTNAYFQSNNTNGVRSNYMNKYLMDKIGFKFERKVNEKTKEEPKSYDGIEYLYSHKDAPGYLFGVRDRHSMATTMYEVENNVLKQIDRHNGTYYHPFSPDGLAQMFEGIIGKPLDLSGLDNLTHFDIYMMKIHDAISKREADVVNKKELEAKLAAIKDDENMSEADKTQAREMLRSLMRLESISDSRELNREILGSLNFPYAWEFYTESFKAMREDFLKSCKKFKNFMTSLWGINRPLMPSCHFGQHGDYEDQLVFHKMISDVVKSKVLGGYGKEFSTKEEMFSMIKLLFGDDYYEKPEKRKSKNKKEETIFMYKGEEVAVWREGEDEEEPGYGYLITEKGF